MIVQEFFVWTWTGKEKLHIEVSPHRTYIQTSTINWLTGKTRLGSVLAGKCRWYQDYAENGDVTAPWCVLHFPGADFHERFNAMVFFRFVHDVTRLRLGFCRYQNHFSHILPVEMHTHLWSFIEQALEPRYIWTTWRVRLRLRCAVRAARQRIRLRDAADLLGNY